MREGQRVVIKKRSNNAILYATITWVGNRYFTCTCDRGKNLMRFSIDRGLRSDDDFARTWDVVDEEEVKIKHTKLKFTHKNIFSGVKVALLDIIEVNECIKANYAKLAGGKVDYFSVPIENFRARHLILKL